MTLAVDLAVLDRDDAVAVAAAAEKGKRLLDAVQLRALAVAAGRRRHEGEVSPVGQELSAATNMHPSTASFRTDLGCSAVTRLPQTLKQLDAGELTLQHVEKIELATRELSDLQAREVDAAVATGGPLGLAKRIARAIARIAPDHVADTVRKRDEDRTIDNWSDPIGGVAGCALQGPLGKVAQIKAAIDLDARTRTTGEIRPIGARRFDVLYDWARERLGLSEPTCPPAPATTPTSASGVASAAATTAPRDGAGAAPTPSDSASKRCGSCGRSGPSQVPINVTVSLETLLHLAETPGDLDGLPIPASVARELAADGRWRRWVTESRTGRLLDVGAATYRPGAGLDRYVRARDRTCRFPSCNRPAERCDLDHTDAFHTEGGETVACNLVALCRHHHRLKHETDWSYELQRNGDVVWTAPSGRAYTCPSEDHYDDPVLSRHIAEAHARRRAKEAEQAEEANQAAEAKRTADAEQKPTSADPWMTPPSEYDGDAPPF